MKRKHARRPSHQLGRCIVATALVAAVIHSRPGLASPQSVYNGDSFVRASSTASTGTATGISLQNGTYSYTFPIDVPPGRLGLQPNVGLTYRSDGAIYGGIAAGWTMDVPSIQLDTSDGILIDERRWVSGLAGGARLEPSAEGAGQDGSYRAKRDLTSIRYDRQHVGLPFEWVARSPSGTIQPAR